MSKNNPILSSTEIKANLEEIGRAEIISNIVTRWLGDGSPFDYRPTRKILISTKNVQFWLHSQENRTVGRIDFSDESKIDL